MKLLLVAAVRAGLAEALSVKAPWWPEVMVIVQLLKVATPLTGVTAPVQPPRVPVPVLMVKVTVFVAFVTRSLAEVSTHTTGDVVNTAPVVVFAGWTLSASLLLRRPP